MVMFILAVSVVGILAGVALLVDGIRRLRQETAVEHQPSSATELFKLVRGNTSKPSFP